MTFLPNQNWDVKGVKQKLPKPDGPIRCEHPQCERYATDRHHIWRRSFLAGAYDFVCLWNGEIVRNITFLCSEHHRQITENKAKISYTEIGTRGFLWYDYEGSGNFRYIGRLSERADVSSSVVCEKCGNALRRKAGKSTHPVGEKRERRKRKSWPVTVPDDNEDGAQVLDVLIEEIAVKLGRDYGNMSAGLRRYYVLAEALAWVLQNSERLEDDARET